MVALDGWQLWKISAALARNVEFGFGTADCNVISLVRLDGYIFIGQFSDDLVNIFALDRKSVV